jgi:hypothetical protein
MDLDKKTLARSILEACEYESLNYRQAGKLLNIPSNSFSLIKRVETYEYVSSKYWQRISEWAKSRQKISQFVIPDSEEIIGQYQAHQPAAAGQIPQVSDFPTPTHGNAVSAPTIPPGDGKSIKPKKDAAISKPKKEKSDGESGIVPASPPPLESPSIVIPPLKLVLDIDLRISVNGVLQHI